MTVATSELDIVTPEGHTAIHATLKQVSNDIAVAVTSDGDEIVMPVTEYLPTRTWIEGERILAVRSERAGRPQLSVTSPELVTLLLEGLVPEVRDGVVRVMSVARAPGVRTKVAVATTSGDVDPVTAIVGRAAGRVKALSKMLGGERIDVIAWHSDQMTYARNALAPAQVGELRFTDEERNEVEAVAPRHQMAAAVGEKGLNSSLAGQLCGLTITVVPAP